MTREERLELLKQIEKDIHVCSLESTLLDDAKSCAIHSVIEELEQEPILDKIRAEIEQEIIPRNSDQYDHEAKWQNLGLRMALKVIDKYKLESEDKE